MEIIHIACFCDYFSDYESPEFLSCPGDFTVYAPRGNEEANVTWSVSAWDNSGTQPNVSCSEDMGLKEEGDLDIRCTARDAAGNERLCVFTVSVEGRQISFYIEIRLVLD